MPRNRHPSIHIPTLSSGVINCFASSFANAKATVEPRAAIEGYDARSERSNADPGFMAAYATPPTIGRSVMLTYHGPSFPERHTETLNAVDTHHGFCTAHLSQEKRQ